MKTPALEEGDRVRRNHLGQGLGGLAEVWQAASLSLFNPLLGVAVAFVAHIFGLDRGLPHHFQDGLVEFGAALPWSVIAVYISSSASATAAFSTVRGIEIEADEATARNSNLLPVKAKGEVRLRSV